MPRIETEIEIYLSEKRISKITKPNDFKEWLQLKYGKKMNRPLFVAVGKGGGQTYKTLWEVFDVMGNSNRKCFFFNKNDKSIRILEENDHLPIQYWLDNLERMPDL